MLLSVFDTTVTDDNLGNAIIMDAVNRHLKQMFPQAFYIKLPYLDRIEQYAIDYIRRSRFTVLGGTNALSSEMETYKQWGLDEHNAQTIRNVILMGVGWWQYQGEVSPYTRDILEQVLHKEYLHSVRDSYTEQKLRSIGITNVVNTACPTMWGLTEEHCRSIPAEKADRAVITFTSYNQSKVDWEIYRIVREQYRKIYAWVQGPEDYEYFQKFGSDIEILHPSLEAFDDLLSSDMPLDYVGTRLHAGIRALQHRRRSIILSIDNRAAEIAKDFNLPVVPRDDLDAVRSAIKETQALDIRLPEDAIAQWKSQFTN